jgi:hypothetical protein
MKTLLVLNANVRFKSVLCRKIGKLLPAFVVEKQREPVTPFAKIVAVFRADNAERL